MSELEEQARNRGIFIAGWEIMEDELRFVLMLRGDPKTCEEFATEVEAGLFELLKELFGLSIKKLVVSSVTDVTPPPEVLTDLRLELKKIHDFQNIFHHLGEEITVHRFQQILKEKGQITEDSQTNLLIQLSLFEEDLETGILRLSPLGHGVQPFFSDIFTLQQELTDVLQVDFTFPLLFLLDYSEGTLTRTKLLELSLLLLQQEFEILEAALDFLMKESYIQSISDENLTLTKIGTEALKQFLTITKAISEEQKGHNIISKAFDAIDDQVQYVIKRSGAVEAFTFGKILESLIRGGVEYDVSLSTVDALSDLFGLSDVIGADELVSSIKRKLIEHDPTREQAERYSFYVNTHAYLSWQIDGRLVPFDRSSLEKRLIIRWFSIPDFSYSGSVVNSLTSKIYDAIRSLHEPILPYWSERGKDLPVELESGLISRLIDYIVSKAIPILAQIPHKSTSNINETIYQLPPEEDAVWDTIRPIVLNEIAAGLTDLKRAQEFLDGEIVRSAADFFKKGALRVLSILLLLLNTFPGLGFLSCASLLQEHARKLRINPTSLIKKRFGEVELPRLLRSLEEFARRSMQVYMLRERSLEMKRTDFENVIRFGINLSERLLAQIGL